MSWLALSLRLTVRSLIRAPRFTAFYVAIAIPSVAFTTLVLSVYRATSLQSRSFAELESLVAVFATADEKCGAGCPDLFDWEAYRSIDAAGVFGGVAAFGLETVGMRVGDRVTEVSVAVVDSKAFDLLGGVVPVGRGFGVADDDPNAIGSVVVSHSLWRRLFGQSVAILGSTIALEERTYAVVGVLRPGGEYPQGVDLWINGLAARRYDPSVRYAALARLNAGAGLTRANEVLRSLGRGLWPDATRSGERRGLTAVSLEQQLGSSSRGLLSMAKTLNVVVFIILGLCLQLLSLTRTMARSSQLGLQLALGASRSRVAGLVLLEAAVLGAVAGVLGLVAGKVLLDWIEPTLRQLFGAYSPLRVDAVVVLGAACAVLLTTVFGAGIAVARVVKPDLARVLQEGSANVTASRKSHRLRDGLICVQLAGTFLLVFISGVLIRSYLSVRQLDLGFDARGLVVASVRPHLAGRAQTPSRASIGATLVEMLRQAGQNATAWSTASPSMLIRPQEPFATIEGRQVDMRTNCRPADCKVPLYMTGVVPGFFATLGIPIVKGREFGRNDGLGTEPVAVVNERAAVAWWPGQEALGMRFKLGGPGSTHPWLTVVGVAKNSQSPNETSLSFAARFRDVFWPAFYVPLGQFPEDRAGQPTWSGYMLVGIRDIPHKRGDLEQHPLMLSIERTGGVSVQRVSSFTDLILDDWLLSRLRANMLFLATMATIAIALSMASVVGMILENIRQQTREFGVRLAVGASAQSLRRLVTWRACRIGLVGTVVGLGTVFIASKLVSRVFFGMNGTAGVFLFGKDPLEPMSLTLGALGVISIVGTVSFLTARRIVSIDPVQALRAEG